MTEVAAEWTAYHGELFAVSFPEGLGPADLSWIAFQFEVLVTFRTTKVEDFGIISHE